MNLFSFLLLIWGVSLQSVQSFIVSPGSMKCGGSSASKNIVISSSSYPQSAPRECVYTITAQNPSVCQIRVNFNLALAPPLVPSVGNQAQWVQCVDDVLLLGDFKLCGRDRNQHLYIYFDRQNDPRPSIDITVRLADRRTNQNLATPAWDLQITQINCPREPNPRTLFDDLPISPKTLYNDDLLRAPTGCAQYFIEPSGIVSSFNYNDGNGAYVGNTKYAICFKRHSTADQFYLTTLHFALGVDPQALILSFLDGISETRYLYDDSCYSQVQTMGRSEDYLLIPVAQVVQDNIRATLFCGDSLQQKSVFSSSPGPIIMIFNSDNIYNPEVPESGFSFSYNVM